MLPPQRQQPHRRLHGQAAPVDVAYNFIDPGAPLHGVRQAAAGRCRGIPLPPSSSLATLCKSLGSLGGMKRWRLARFARK